MGLNRDAFHREAVQTPSHDDPTEMRDLLVETLTGEDYEPEIDETGNVLVTRGTAPTSSTHLVLNTHLDTVPPHVPYDRDGDIIRGRGACDAKGPLAALLDAFCTAQIDSGQVTLAVTPNEETAQTGGAHLGATLSADAVIVGEPTGLDVCPAARGNFGGQITVSGERAHASDPTAGVNAIRAIPALLDALDEYDMRRGPGEHDVLGAPTLTPTAVESGGVLNQTPGTCTVYFDRRTVPPETIEGFLADLHSYLEGGLSSDYGLDVRPAFPDSAYPDAFSTGVDSALVRTLATMSGGEIRPFEAATEASYFAANAPTVVFGPGVLSDEEGPVAHAAREYINQESIEDAATAVRATIEELLS